MPQKTLQDNYGRQISYLRISVTDRCNFMCRYCMPTKGVPLLCQDEILSYAEIMQVVKTALQLGITKFRITGGEPLTRPGIIGFLERLIKTPGVEWVSLTTNGFFLKQHYQALANLGLNGINISLNSLKEDTFAQLTGVRGLQKVWQGIEALLQSGFENIKINTVLMRGFNDDEVMNFARLTIKRPIVLRYIEYMPCGNWQNNNFDRTIPAKEVIAWISKLGRLVPVNKHLGNGPARYYQLVGACGFIGFITPVSQPFCDHCNRLRLTADGQLKACLLSRGSIDLKPILRLSETPQENLENAFVRATSFKPRVHQKEQLTIMSRIGG